MRLVRSASTPCQLRVTSFASKCRLGDRQDLETAGWKRGRCWLPSLTDRPAKSQPAACLLPGLDTSGGREWFNPAPAGTTGVRRTDRSQDHRGNRQCHPIQQRSGIRALHRRRSAAALLGFHRWSCSLHKVRQPAAQHRGPSHRGHPNPPGRPGPTLLRRAPPSRRFVPGSGAQIEATHQPCRVQPIES